jgi:hypothetical protein
MCCAMLLCDSATMHLYTAYLYHYATTPMNLCHAYKCTSCRKIEQAFVVRDALRRLPSSVPQSCCGEGSRKIEVYTCRVSVQLIFSAAALTFCFCLAAVCCGCFLFAVVCPLSAVWHLLPVGVQPRAAANAATPNAATAP